MSLDRNTILHCADIVSGLVRLGEHGEIEETLRRLAASTPRAEAVTPRVDLNDKGHLDEVVSNYCHLEQMDGSQWFLDAGNVRVWLFSKSKITASFERSDMNSRRSEG